MGVIGAIFIALGLAPGGLLGALWLWARWLRRRTAAPPVISFAAYLVLGVGVGTAVAGPGMAIILGVPAINRAASAVDRQRLLAGLVAEVFYDQALTALLVVVVALWLTFATWRWHWAARPRATD